MCLKIKKMKLKYFTAFSIILIIEICISFTKGFIRYTLGDYFAVILLYLFIKSFTNFSVNTEVRCYKEKNRGPNPRRSAPPRLFLQTQISQCHQSGR